MLPGTDGSPPRRSLDCNRSSGVLSSSADDACRSLDCNRSSGVLSSSAPDGAEADDACRSLDCSRSSGVVSIAARSSPMLPRPLVAVDAECCTTLERSRSSGVVEALAAPLVDALALARSATVLPTPRPWTVTPGTPEALADAARALRWPLPAEYDAWALRCSSRRRAWIKSLVSVVVVVVALPSDAWVWAVAVVRVATLPVAEVEEAAVSRRILAASRSSGASGDDEVGTRCCCRDDGDSSSVSNGVDALVFAMDRGASSAAILAARRSSGETIRWPSRPPLGREAPPLGLALVLAVRPAALGVEAEASSVGRTAGPPPARSWPGAVRRGSASGSCRPSGCYLHRRHLLQLWKQKQRHDDACTRRRRQCRYPRRRPAPRLLPSRRHHRT